MALVFPELNLTALLPQMIVLGTALAVLLADLVWHNKKALGLLSLAGVLAAGIVAILSIPGPLQPAAALQNMAVADRFSLIVTVVVALAAALAILLSLEYAVRIGLAGGEYYGLLLLSAAGMMFMGAATHLITIFLSLEILSISLYALAGLNRGEARSGEAALKYLLLGGFASAFLLYGMALIYGATGTTALAGIAAAISATAPGTLLFVGLGLMLVGFGFKVAAVPFHMWTPDVYQGAPTAITAFMSAGTKAATFGALIRLLLTAFPALSAQWMWPVAILAALTMTWGNLAALSQTNLKRMLAYSSIAHAGYMLVGVAAGAPAAGAVLFYLLAYALMNIGAFAVLIAFERSAPEDAAGITLDRVQGLFRTGPWFAAAMTIFMLSLAGFPPLVGFFGKLYVFEAAIQSNLMWLAIFGVVNSVISAYYYLRVVARMALEAPAEECACFRCLGLNIGTGVAAVGTVLVGLWPALLFLLVKGTTAALFGG